jgi:predicted ArsR family transcriptional regulator
MTLTPEEGRRLHALTLLEGKRISLGQAAEALGLTPRQVRRLRVGLRRDGPARTHSWQSGAARAPSAPAVPPDLDRRPCPGSLRRAQ